MTTLWTAHSDCPEHIKIKLEARVRSLFPSFLLLSIAGEVFEDSDTCQERLQDWVLLQGFVIVRTSNNLKQTYSRFEFRCIHHGDDTVDTCKLEKHVIRDEENNVVSRRKQEIIRINVRSCLYLVILLRKQVRKRESNIYDLVLNISNDIYSHLMIINLLRYYKKYVKTLSDYLFVIKLDKSLRTINISYSVTLRVFEQTKFLLNYNIYYNIRSRIISIK